MDNCVNQICQQIVNVVKVLRSALAELGTLPNQYQREKISGYTLRIAYRTVNVELCYQCVLYSVYCKNYIQKSAIDIENTYYIQDSGSFKYIQCYL